MIVYLVSERHSYTMRSFLESWGRALAPRFVVATYEAVLAGARLPLGEACFVFSDIDRIDGIDATARTRLSSLHDRLVETCGPQRVLNDPARSLPRGALLEALHAEGINAFRAWLAHERLPGARFPVFLRKAAGFAQDDLALLDSATSYAAARDAYLREGGRLEEALAIEFCDTADAGGVYRKYGAFVVGGRVVARHLFFSRNWQVRYAELDDPAYLAEELAYLQANPHAETLGRIARLARIGWGRIDYSLLDGRPQVWEINSNPMIASGISAEISARRPAHLAFVARLGEALDALEAGGRAA